MSVLLHAGLAGAGAADKLVTLFALASAGAAAYAATLAAHAASMRPGSHPECLTCSGLSP